MQRPSMFFQDQQVTATALVDIMFIYTNGLVQPATLQAEDLRFVEVVLHMCVRGYESDVKSGVKTTKEEGSIWISHIIAPLPGRNMTSLSLNAAWNTDKFETTPYVSCRDGIAGLMVGLAAPEGIPGDFAVDYCTALMTSSVLNNFLPGFFALRADKTVANRQIVGMISGALGSALYGGFMEGLPGPQAQIENIKGMA